MIRVVLVIDFSDYHGNYLAAADPKCSHLKELPKSSNLKLFKADLLDYDSLCAAIQGCNGVFHVASPVPAASVSNPEAEVIEPTVKGTLNVLKACVEVKVQRVVYVSSGTAVSMIPNWPKDQVMDETCWSDKEYCRSIQVALQTWTSFISILLNHSLPFNFGLIRNIADRSSVPNLFQNWYRLSKTEAEGRAFEFAKATGLDFVSVCPTFILGPVLQPTVNASSLVLLRLLKEGHDSTGNKCRTMVDVRDVAEALLLAYKKAETLGRYICAAHMISAQEMIEILKGLYPNYNYPQSFIEGAERLELSSQKLQRLGWSYRPVQETLVDSVESFKKAGMLD
ncbi:Cinnamoyl-CoA reductase 1 [Linum grandiflorum]